MARPQTSPILNHLRSAKTLSDQTAALQALKNEIVGHIQRKEAWVALGVLDPIVRALRSDAASPQSNGKDARFQLVSRPLSEEDALKLQALQLIASFANGGPSFLLPLAAADAVPAILANISPYTSPPQIVVSALRALTDISDSAADASAPSLLDSQTLADSVFTSAHIDSLNALLSISSAKLLLQSQVTLAAGLIQRLCREERHQQALTSAGVLDTLATRLASFAVSDGHVVPGADQQARKDGLADAFPDAAVPGAKLGPVLDAITSILGESKYRALRLVSSPSILAVFPSLQWEFSRLSPGFPQESGSTDSNGRARDSTPMDFLLPAVPTSRGPSLPSSIFGSQGRRAPSRATSRGQHSNGDFTMHFPLESSSGQSSAASEEAECPIVPWLIHLVRSRADHERLAAAAVVTALFRAGLGNRAVREASLSLLVVPVLVSMIAKHDAFETHGERPRSASHRMILERAPAILARLIRDKDSLQKAAFECDAGKVLTKLLKSAYSPVNTIGLVKYWSPEPDTMMDVEASSPVRQLGVEGQNPELAYRIKLREASLKAIGALAAGKEEYRKALVKEEAIPFVVECLSEAPRKPRPSKQRQDKANSERSHSGPAAKYGSNPLSVIIAACQVVRMLARSVSILRTDLVDHGVALPVFQFMKHPNMEVQISATAAIINLVHEVSPVRELLVEHGVKQVLCDHARSENPALRLNAVWALKHFVDAVGTDLKMACLQELEPGWLVQLICDDTQEAPVANQHRAGDVGEADDDVDMQPSDGVVRWIYGNNGTFLELDASKSSRLRQAEDRLSALREAEVSPSRKAQADDVAIQEQGLDFIRNLIGRPGPGPSSETPLETTEMIDHVFNEIGQDRLFEILASKVRTKVLHPFSRRTSTAGPGTRVINPPARIVAAVIYVLIHIAASIPRHRQLVVAQTELMKLLAQQATNRDREVRVALCHLITNLTWQDDGDDVQACAQRAQELKKLGFYAKMEALKNKDADLDVRERAKGAMWQMENVS